MDTDSQDELEYAGDCGVKEKDIGRKSDDSIDSLKPLRWNYPLSIARMASFLPVAFDASHIRCRDGSKYSGFLYI